MGICGYGATSPRTLHPQRPPRTAATRAHRRRARAYRGSKPAFQGRRGIGIAPRGLPPYDRGDRQLAGAPDPIAGSAMSAIVRPKGHFRPPRPKSAGGFPTRFPNLPRFDIITVWQN